MFRCWWIGLILSVCLPQLAKGEDCLPSPSPPSQERKVASEKLGLCVEKAFRTLHEDSIPAETLVSKVVDEVCYGDIVAVNKLMTNEIARECGATLPKGETLENFEKHMLESFQDRTKANLLKMLIAKRKNGTVNQ